MTLATAASGALAANDDSLRDNATIQTRKLQTELMVAALYCGQQVRYNAFIQRFSGELIANGKELRTLFVSMHGAKRAVPQLDTFLTKMANEASQRRLSAGASYCQEAQSLFTQVLSLPTRQLIAFASDRARAPQTQGRITYLQIPGL
jgi:hypothetical protein